MKRTFALLSIFAVAITGVMVTPGTSSAVPAFARQTGYECMACHYQFFPKLSAMGRAFKLGGYTDASAATIEGDNLSLMAGAPVSMIVKLRYLMSTKKNPSDVKEGEERGEWNIPDEAVFYLGGRASANVGYSIELAEGLWGKGAIIFNLPIGGDTKVGINVQSSDGHGPLNGMDMMNAGLIKGIRGFENRDAAFAGMKAGFDTNASGLGIHAGNELWFVNVGLWGAADYHQMTMDAGFDMAPYARLVITPNVGGFDVGLGAFWTSGDVKCVACGVAEGALATLKHEVTAIDFQAQGDVGGMSLELQAAYVMGGKDTAWPGTEVADMNVAAFLGLTPSFGVKASVMSSEHKSGGVSTKESATNIGIWYMIAQNVNLAPEYAIYGGDGRSLDNKLVVLLFMAF